MKSVIQGVVGVAVVVVVVWAIVKGGSWLKEVTGWDADTNRQIRIEKKLDAIDAKVEKLVKLGEKYE